MPSGYTAGVNEGKVTTAKEYILGCARAFGALSMMRDDPRDAPIPDKIGPIDYHLRQIERSKEELEKYKSMTPEEAAVLVQEKYDEEVARRIKEQEKTRVIKARYDEMIRQVEQWESPSEEHDKLKTFALNQLHESMEWDCDRKEDYYDPDKVEKQDPQEYIKATIEYLENDLKEDMKKHNEAVQHAEERTLWIQQLKQSL